MSVVAVIGTGEIGSRICGRLVGAGYETFAFDQDEKARRGALERGAHLTSSAAEAAQKADYVILCVGDESDVEAVILGEGQVASHIRSGRTLIDTTSSKPAVTQRIGEILARQSIAMLDAPTSRGSQAAESGTMSVIVGGDADVLESSLPVLRTFGSDIYHIGPLGSGHAAKALNMVALAAALVGTAEVMDAASADGLSPGDALSTINGSAAASYASTVHFPKFVMNESFRSGFSLALMEKDLRIAVETAHDAHSQVPIAERLLALYGMMTSELGRAADNTLVCRYRSLLRGGTPPRVRTARRLHASEGTLEGVRRELRATLSAIHLVTLLELLATGDILGLAPHRLLTVISASSGMTNSIIEGLVRAGIEGESVAASIAGGSTRDVKRGIDLSSRLGWPSFVTEVVRTVYGRSLSEWSSARSAGVKPLAESVRRQVSASLH